MTALVVQTSFLGDMVLTTPLIAELAKRGPVDVVATPANAPLLANNPDVRDVIVYDKRREGMSGLFGISSTLRKGGAYHSPPGDHKTAYLCQGSLRSALLAFLSGYRERIGFNTSSGSWLYSQRVLYRDDLHHAARLLTLTGIQNPSREQIRPRLYPGVDDIDSVDAIGIKTPFIALAPGSVWATKRWPYFAELAELLAKRTTVAIIGGAGDRESADEILARVPGAIDTTGKLSLLASAELIRRADLLVTNDSSPQHLASAMDTPTITIFGPTVPDFGFGPLAGNSQSIGHDSLSCRPCDRHGPQKCPLTHWRCMREVGAQSIFNVICRYLNSSSLA